MTEKRKKSDQKLLDKIRDDYLVKEMPYKDGPKLELWRYNSKGYYNVVCYIKPEDSLDDLILADAKALKSRKHVATDTDSTDDI